MRAGGKGDIATLIFIICIQSQVTYKILGGVVKKKIILLVPEFSVWTHSASILTSNEKKSH